jgi:xanthine dehydrogenase accessory factor
VTIVDCRASETTPARFAIADRVILTRRETLSQQVEVDKTTIAVVMTHHYLDDLEALKILLLLPARYIGVLGSRNRSDRLLQELLLVGAIRADEPLNHLYAPVGVDIGADTPEAIALSIITEIQRVLTNCSGRSLRDCQGSIHTASS